MGRIGAGKITSGSNLTSAKHTFSVNGLLSAGFAVMGFDFSDFYYPRWDNIQEGFSLHSRAAVVSCLSFFVDVVGVVVYKDVTIS